MLDYTTSHRPIAQLRDLIFSHRDTKSINRHNLLFLTWKAQRPEEDSQSNSETLYAPSGLCASHKPTPPYNDKLPMLDLVPGHSENMTGEGFILICNFPCIPGEEKMKMCRRGYTADKSFPRSQHDNRIQRIVFVRSLSSRCSFSCFCCAFCFCSVFDKRIPPCLAVVLRLCHTLRHGLRPRWLLEVDMRVR